MIFPYFLIGKNYSVADLKNKYYALKSNQQGHQLTAPLSENKYEIQWLKSEKAREKAELMTEKAEEVRKRRIELEGELLAIQKERELVLLEVAKLQKEQFIRDNSDIKK